MVVPIIDDALCLAIGELLVNLHGPRMYLPSNAQASGRAGRVPEMGGSRAGGHFANWLPGFRESDANSPQRALRAEPPRRSRQCEVAASFGTTRAIFTAMPFHQLPRARWQEFFDDLTRVIDRTTRVDIEVIGLDVGDQIEAQDMTLNGLTYEAKSDTFYVYSDGAGNSVDHAIPHPREIWVELGPGGLSRVVVKDTAGHQQFVTMKEPLALSDTVHEELRSLQGQTQMS